MRLCQRDGDGNAAVGQRNGRRKNTRRHTNTRRIAFFAFQVDANAPRSVRIFYVESLVFPSVTWHGSHVSRIALITFVTFVALGAVGYVQCQHACVRIVTACSRGLFRAFYRNGEAVELVGNGTHFVSEGFCLFCGKLGTICGLCGLAGTGTSLFRTAYEITRRLFCPVSMLLCALC